MKRADIINKLMLSKDKEIFKILDYILKYDNMKFNFDMFFESTPLYQLQFQNPFTNESENWIEPLPLRHVIPDFLMDNFTELRREETKIITDFLRIFIVRVLILNLVFVIKKNQNLYLSPIKSYQYIVSTINNRKNVEYFFKNFFKRKVQIIENIPERFINYNQFKLGQTSLTSRIQDQIPTLGTDVFTSLNKYQVILDINFEELKNLEDCIMALTKKKMLVLRSSNIPKPGKRYYFSLMFVGTLLKGISTYSPNEVSYA